MRPDSIWISEMLDGVTTIGHLASGATEGTRDVDACCFDALVRQIVKVGEAASQVSQTLRERYPAIPWREVIGTRNVDVHQYWAIQEARVLAVGKRELPPLQPLLEGCLAALEATSE